MVAMEDRKNPSSFSHSCLCFICLSAIETLRKKYYILQSVNRLSVWGKKQRGKGRERRGERACVASLRKNGRARGRHARRLPSRVSLSRARSFLRPLLPSAWHAGYLSTCSQAIYTITLVSALLSPDHPVLPPFQNEAYKKYL